jgi:tellurite resistance protein TerC
VLLLVLAYRIFRGAGDEVDPSRNVVVRAVRRIFPVTEGFRGRHWFVRDDGRRHVTPAFLCLTAIVAADIAFAVDSIPAAFAITTDPLIIWMANVFALVGLRSLFALVEGLIRRFRYLDQTIAVVLALIAAKLLLEPVVKIGPVASLAMVAVAFAVGIGASLVGDKRDPEGAEERRARNGEPAHAGGSDA